jgi:5-deoxy-glucuronate isomerase
MARIDYVAHSLSLPSGQSGELIAFSREEAGWEWMSFSVRRLAPEAIAEYGSLREEVALVLLSGRCRADWGEGEQLIGQRENVFAGFPYALYLPAGNRATLKGETMCEVAECRVPSSARLEPRLVTPQDVVSSIRGGENSSRQIVEIIRSEFPADRLIAIEVYTPAGNWSSYPPHKHDVHAPPTEVDLDEIYYYRINDPRGFALQTLYKSEPSSNLTLKVHDGDAVPVREGYHPVVAGPGYDVYYLNFLAGTSRTLAVTEDPDHLWIRSAWKQPDPRLPLVRS